MVAITNLPISSTQNVEDSKYDCFVYLATNLEKDLANHPECLDDLKALKALNKSFESDITFTLINKKRVLYAPTGPLDRDYDDVRRVQEAALHAFEKAIKLGSQRPLLINCVKNSFEHAELCAVLGALDAAHYPLEVREQRNLGLLKIEELGLWGASDDLIKQISAIELGRIMTRDIGGSDPERMSAEGVMDYVLNAFKGSSIKCDVIEGQKHFEKDFPCFAAVNRAAATVKRHQGRIINLEYNPVGSIVDTTLFLVGKGINYDTGGADVKAGGHMAGMHRDKCGAAFVAGFFKTLELLKPKGIKVYGNLCMARNSIGEECYVADEIIKSRAGKIVRVGNTDAEGRMVMVDLLCLAKEKALAAINPQLYTIATLTGHVIRAYGPDYTAVMSNGPARSAGIPQTLFTAGDVMADPYEISTIRREDFKAHTGPSEYEDILQANNFPSTMTSRGHQNPSAFLIMASGLDEHGNDSKSKLPYTHVDIAGSSGPFPGKPTGAPLPSFFKTFILPRL
jgi:leucyl aminopeptidase